MSKLTEEAKLKIIEFPTKKRVLEPDGAIPIGIYKHKVFYLSKRPHHMNSDWV